MKTARIISVSFLLVVFSAITAPAAGINWQWQNPLPQGNTLNGVWGAAGNDVFAVGERGTILHYDGTAWSRMDSPTTATLMGIWGGSGSDVFAVGDNGTILHFNGASWRVTGGNAFPELSALWGSSESGFYAVGQAGTIIHSTFKPVKASTDFDADSRSDIGVFFDQTGTWYVNRSTGGYRDLQFGFPGTSPVVGDFDGDGATDYGVYDPRTGMWYLIQSSQGYQEKQWGFAGTRSLH